METEKNSPPTELVAPSEPKPSTELMPPSEPKPPKRLKQCKHRQCTSLYLRFVGHCPHCHTDFCGEHRLPEAHECAKMEDCRLEAFNKNKTRLESERTVASKMAVA